MRLDREGIKKLVADGEERNSKAIKVLNDNINQMRMELDLVCKMKTGLLLSQYVEMFCEIQVQAVKKDILSNVIDRRIKQDLPWLTGEMKNA